MKLKKIFGQIHLWLGFIAGLVVFISLLAAAIFVWERELTDWYYHDKVFVKEVLPQRLPFDTLIVTAKAASHNHEVNYVNISNEPDRAVVFMNTKPAKNPGWTYNSTLEAYSRIYVDPYSGKVLGMVDLRYDWIAQMRLLHQYLLLNKAFGHYIVGFATLIILVMIITGIVLWWPKNKAALKQRIWFKWKQTTRWKRKNYDVHNIGGMYTFLLILFFATTGLVWTFGWWQDGIYSLLGNDPEKVWHKPATPAIATGTTAHFYDKVVADASSRLPGWTDMGFSIQTDSIRNKAALMVYIHYISGHSGWDQSNYYYYHPQTGKLYDTYLHDQKKLGAKWRNSNYALHVGSIYGLPSKIIACFTALFCASLPVTGFFIWWGRRKKKKGPKVDFPSS